MQIFLKDGKGNSIENAIILDAQDTLTGLTLEHCYIDQLINSLDVGIEAIDQGSEK